MMPLRSFQSLYHSVRVCISNYRSKSFLLCTASRFKQKDFIRNCYVLSCYEDKDPAPLFFDSNVQATLKRLAGKNIEKIFKNRELENVDASEEYKFLTKEDLGENLAKSMVEAERLMQMPPVVRERNPVEQILSYDPALQGSLIAKTVFVDISYGVSDRKRIIVVRDRDGTLRHATWEERDRMNHIYNPRPGKYYRVPELFQEKYLKDALDREEYLFVLDFACAQFEPDDPLFHKSTAETYEHIRNRSAYEVLYSTRHFGPMCFYFAWNKQIDNLLLKYIHEERIDEAVDLSRLHYLVHAKEKAPKEQLEKQEQLDCLKKYIEEDSVLKPNLDLALSMYKENLRGRENFEKAVKTSHGVS